VSRVSPAQASGVFLTCPSLTFAPYPLGFSTIEVQALGLMNNLASPLNISSVNVNGGGFSQANDSGTVPPVCQGIIAPGAGCVVRIQFAPTTTGPQSGTLTITDDGPGSPRTVALNGMGQADFTLRSSSNTFATVRGTDSLILNIYSNSDGGPGLSGNIALSCSGATPAVCTFLPTSIPVVAGSADVTISGLSAANRDPFNFSVLGTLGGQTFTLPLSITFDADFAMTTAQSAATIKAGDTATYSLIVTPLRGFNAGMSIACTRAPTLATCSVAPVPFYTDGRDPATATVSVTTTARSGVPSRYPIDISPFNLGTWLEAGSYWILFWLAVLLALVRMAGTRRKRLRPAWIVIAATLLFLAPWASCGGGGSTSGGGGGPPAVPSGTPAGTYTLTIVATSGSLSHSTTLTLTVQ